MEMTNNVTYLPNMPVKESKNPAPEKGDKQGAFSDVLKQEASQGQECTSNKTQEQENQPMENAESNVGSQKAAEVLWPVQLPVIQIPQQAENKNVVALASSTANTANTAEAPVVLEAITTTNAEAGNLLDGKTEESNVTNFADAVKPSGEAEVKSNKTTTFVAPLEDTAPAIPTVKTEVVQPASGMETASQQEPVKTEYAAAPQVNTNQLNGQKEKSDADVIQSPQTVNAGEQKVYHNLQESVPTTNVEQPSTTKAEIPKLPQAMMEQISKGKTEFEIQLEPANLGKLAIKVAYEGGKAAVSIICTNEKTMELISQNAKNLGAILEERMGTGTVVVVEQPQADYLQQQANQQNQKENPWQQASNDADQTESDNETGSLSFLQQLRLGLA